MLLAAGYVASAQNIDEPSMIDMEEVVVTATKTPLLLKETPVITRVVTEREILKSGASDISDVLSNELAGVEFHQTAYGNSISFQGLDARYVLFLVDGEKMAGETYGNIDFTRLPIDNIERIEIVRGASSVLYGSSAMGAIVNIITKKQSEPFSISGSFGYGMGYQNNNTSDMSDDPTDGNYYNSNLDLPNLDANISIGFTKGRLRSKTTFDYSSSDAYQMMGSEAEERFYEELTATNVIYGTSETTQNVAMSVDADERGLSISGQRVYNLSQRFDYDLNDKFKFMLYGSYNDNTRYDFNETLIDQTYNPMSTTEWTWQSYRGYSAKAEAEYAPNDNNLFVLSFVRDLYARDLDSLSGASVDKQRHVYNTPRLLWTTSIGDHHRLVSGIEYTNEELKFDLHEGDYDDAKTLNSGAIYVQDEISGLSIPMSFTAGLRAEYNSRSEFGVTPKVSAKYDLGSFAFRANYSMGYRNPTLKELYMSYDIPIPGLTTTILGNESLEQEHNNYFSLSAEYTNSWANLSATLYNSYFNNKIDVVRSYADDGTIQYEYANISKSELCGVELAARFIIAKGLTLKANYNYIYSQENSTDGTTQYIFPSANTGTAQVDWAFGLAGSNFNLHAAVRYVGEKDYEDFMPTYSYSYSSTGVPTIILYTGTYSGHHDDYAVADASLTYFIPNFGALTVGVDNLFDYSPSIVNYNSGVTVPRNGYVKLSFSL